MKLKLFIATAVIVALGVGAFAYGAYRDKAYKALTLGVSEEPAQEEPKEIKGEPVEEEPKEAKGEPAEKEPKEAKGEPDTLEENSLSLAYRLNKLMDKNTSYIFSPTSLKYALAMTVNGAEGETREEMLKVLGYSDVEALNKDMAVLSEGFNTKGDAIVNTANSIWVNKDCGKINSLFEKTVNDVYKGEVISEKKEKIPKLVKAWVNEKSNGMQKDFELPMSNEFAMALVNTTYFKAKWADKFDPSDTRENVFYNADGTEGKTDFMHLSERERAYADDEIQMVELRYRDKEKDLSFYGAMAPEGTDLEGYIDKLTSRKIIISLPKFRQESKLNLNDTLAQMGAEKMFIPFEAELNGLFEVPDPDGYHVSDVIQEAVIEVDEAGTEAAATTAAIVQCNEAIIEEEEPLVINFNKPFTYFVRDNATGEILFMGYKAMA